MKIVYLLNSIGNTGGAIVLYNFIENLVNRKYEVYIVTPSICLRWEKGTREKILTSKEIQSKEKRNYSILRRFLKSTVGKKVVASDEWFERVGLINATKQIVKNFREEVKNCDILVCTLWTTAFAAYFLADKVSKIFYHIQQYEELLSPESKIKREYARMTYFYPFHLITNSTWVKNILQRVFNKPSYLVCPGIDLNVFYPNTDYKVKYNSTKQRFLISSFVDAKRKFKGSGDLFEVINILNREIGKDRVLFRLFGFSIPSYYSQIENVEFEGIIPHRKLRDFYSSTDLFIWPSWYESFPLPPIESMASGTALVSTQFGTEDYAVDGYNSYVVLPRSPVKLAEKVVTALDNIKETGKLVENALLTVKQFCWEKQTDKLEQIFNEAECIEISSELNWLVESLINGKNIEQVNERIIK